MYFLRIIFLNHHSNPRRWVLLSISYIEGFQNKPPPNMLLLHENYFELKAIETLWIEEKFLPLLNYLEEFKLVFPRIRVITRDKFYLNSPSVSQGKHLITQHLLFFLLSCKLPSCPWKPQAPSLFLSSRWHIYLIFLSLKLSCMWGLWPSHIWGVPIHTK